MSKVITATVKFEFYPEQDVLMEMFGEDMSDQDVLEYYKETASSDITEMVLRYPEELWNAIDVQVINVRP